MRATVRIILRKDYTRKDGKQQLCLRYIAHQTSTFIGLGISILAKDWDCSTLIIRKSEPMAYHYNKLVQETYQKAVNMVLENFYTPLTVKTFRTKLLDNKVGNFSFYDFIASELEILKVDRAEGTISNYNKLINTLKVWKSELNFDEINLDFIEKFHTHESKEGNLESTIYKKHANFKFLIGRAVLKDKITSNPYERFQIKKVIKSQNNDILTEKEIQKLQKVYNENIYSKGKQEVLRNFLFSCYTSLSFAEFSVVTHEDLEKHSINKKEYLLLTNNRTKNDIPYKIPIVSSVVENLLGKGLSFEKIFSPLSNQPTNRYLKDIMKEQQIGKNITFHRARHTFRTISARKGISESVAERIMGHALGNDIKDIYTHLDDKDILQEMINKWIV